LAMTTPRKGFPLSIAQRNATVIPTDWGRSSRSDPAVATRGSIIVGPWGLDDVIVVAGKEMAGRRYGVVPSWRWNEWGPTVQRSDRDFSRNLW
jgi:hypothetical protein